MNEIVNSARFTGRLGKDPEMKYTASGVARLSFSIAVDMRKKGADDKYEKSTVWVPLAVFGKSAENMTSMLQKGSLITVEGAYATSSWEGEDGTKQYSHNFIVRSWQLLTGGRSKDEAAAAVDESDEEFPF